MLILLALSHLPPLIFIGGDGIEKPKLDALVTII